MRRLAIRLPPLRPLRILALLLLTARASLPPPIPVPLRRLDAARIHAGDILGGSPGRCGSLVHQVRPVYPREAKMHRVQGVVEMSVLITRAGVPTEIRVLHGDPRLAPAALAAVRQWRYVPCTIGAHPVDIRTTIDVDFNLAQ